MENCDRFVFYKTSSFSFLRSSSENHYAKRRFSCCFSYFCSTFSFKHRLTVRNSSLYVKIWFFFVHVEEKNYFYEKPKTKQPALRDMLRHFHGLYSHRPQLSTNQRARIRSVILKLRMVVYHLQNVSGKYSWKVNRKGPLGSFQRKISGSNGTFEKLALFFGTECSKRVFVFHFFKVIFWYLCSFSLSRLFFGNWNWN